MDFSTLSSVIQIMSGILALISGIWALVFGSKSVYDLVQSRRQGVTYKINPLVVLNVVLTILVLILSSLLAFLLPKKPEPNISTQLYPPSGWKLRVDDPMKSNEHSWAIGPYTNGTCSFTKETYQVNALRPDSTHYCLAREAGYSDFAFEVEMTIVEGDAGSIFFRNSGENAYYFYITTQGFYRFEIWLANERKEIASSESSAIHTGINHPNLITVVAQGDTFHLYANDQLLTSATDKTLDQGLAALAATNTANSGSTKIIISHLKIWVPSS